MTTSLRLLRAVLIGLVLGGCGEGPLPSVPPPPPLPPTPPELTGALLAVVSTTGDGRDPDGYLAVLDGVTRHPLGGTDSTQFDALRPGIHTLGLESVANSCQVEGMNPRTVLVNVLATAREAFDLACFGLASTTGTLALKVENQGPHSSETTYTASISRLICFSSYFCGAGASKTYVVPDSGLTIDGLTPGHVLVRLFLPVICTYLSSGNLVVDVAAGHTTPARFQVACS